MRGGVFGRVLVLALLSLPLFATAAAQQAGSPNNETNQSSEADYCVIEFPKSYSMDVGQTIDVYGQIFEAGVTESPSASSSITAHVGLGSSGGDPTTDGGWAYRAAAFHSNVGNNDEYAAALAAPQQAGTYAYVYRFSLDGGISWTYCDTDGAGSGPDLAFDKTKLGVLTVSGGSQDGDGDGVPDSTDNCPANANPGQADADGDGIGDACDLVHGSDADGDTVPDATDNCPAKANPDQADLDEDGRGDRCDPDDDGDGVKDRTDNCPRVPNPDQRDRDRNGKGNACDRRRPGR